MRRAGRMAALAVGATLLGAAAPVDGFERVVAALQAGLAAPDAAARAKAAAGLAADGAHPLDGGPDLAGLWKARNAPPYRNRALGPGYRSLRLEAGASASLEQTFLGGQRARVAAFSRDAAAFSLAVKDDDGARACGAGPPRAECDWLPVYTGRVTITLANRAERAGDFLIVVQ